MISTHILDTSKGHPAGGVSVKLHRQEGGNWKEVGQGTTNADGRCSFDGESPTGTYQLIFEVGAYLKDGAAFYTSIPVIFSVSDAKKKYHVPLLLSPFGYSTYRGS